MTKRQGLGCVSIPRSQTQLRPEIYWTDWSLGDSFVLLLLKAWSAGLNNIKQDINPASSPPPSPTPFKRCHVGSKIRSRPAVRPRRLGLPLCTHARVPVKPEMTSSSIHHRQRGRALPSAVQPLHQASEEGRGAEEGKGGEAGGEPTHTQMQTHRYSLVKLEQYVRHCRLLPHQIRHMFLSSELLRSQPFVSATILQRAREKQSERERVY